MNNKKFSSVAMNPDNPKYQQAIQRPQPIYTRENDFRDAFERDYHRILFSKAYRRLKHKTQVFFAVSNDHICTRLEHVTLVQSVSETIAENLGLNPHLVRTIAAGHDLGHAPFGHGGERILSKLYEEYELGKFFHEKNSLYFVDHIETLKDDAHYEVPLNLSYAVRDGLISHCGEVHLEAIYPRDEVVDLENYIYPGQYQPFTYEGCVVKMADKIAYLSRDIEDALELGILDSKDLEMLLTQLQSIDPKITGIDNGTLIHYFIMDVTLASTPEKGIALTKKGFAIMQEVMRYNYQQIYLNERLRIYDDYVALMIHSLFNVLKKAWDIDDTYKNLEKMKNQYPTLVPYFLKWLKQYALILDMPRDEIYKNAFVYDLKIEKDYLRAILDYISGMTDTFIMKSFNELVTF